jgi:hypothetical protein
MSVNELQALTQKFAYYDAVVSPSVAKLSWKVRPARPKNVVPIKAAQHQSKSLARPGSIA